MDNKVATILGGARMGRSIGTALARDGYSVAFGYHSSKRSADDNAHEMERLGVRSQAFRVDASNEKSVKSFFSVVQKQFRRIDVIVNLVSIYEQVEWRKLKGTDFCRALNHNLLPAYLTGIYGAPALTKTKGRLIHFADWLAASGRPRYKNFVPYYTAKMALLGLTQIQALELAPNVLVNCIAPGPIVPAKNESRSRIRQVIQETPLHKWGGPDEIAKAVLFLTQTSFVTGECIRVDGGRHLL